MMYRGNQILITGVLALMLLSAAGCGGRPEKLVDRDGNSYTALQVGTMIWTGKNLGVAHYRNGDSIPEVRDHKEWANLTTGAWCYNDNKQENGATYGKLYNWYAVNDQRGLAPKGWHVATDAEWSALGDVFGGSENAGSAMKAPRLWKDQKSEGRAKAVLRLYLPGHGGIVTDNSCNRANTADYGLRQNILQKVRGVGRLVILMEHCEEGRPIKIQGFQSDASRINQYP